MRLPCDEVWPALHQLLLGLQLNVVLVGCSSRQASPARPRSGLRSARRHTVSCLRSCSCMAEQCGEVRVLSNADQVYMFGLL